MVGLGRFELPTSRLSGVRSDQLSYRPVTRKEAPPALLSEGPRDPLAVVLGLEPLAAGSPRRRVSRTLSGDAALPSSSARTSRSRPAP